MQPACLCSVTKVLCRCGTFWVKDYLCTICHRKWWENSLCSISISSVYLNCQCTGVSHWSLVPKVTKLKTSHLKFEFFLMSSFFSQLWQSLYEGRIHPLKWSKQLKTQLLPQRKECLEGLISIIINVLGHFLTHFESWLSNRLDKYNFWFTLCYCFLI
jgi:hypothetical protein